MSQTAGDPELGRAETSNFADVIAVVDDPATLPTPDRGWQKIAMDLAYGLGIPSVVAAVVVYRWIQSSSEPPPHVAVLAVDQAMTLVRQGTLSFPEGEPVVGEVYARHPLRRNEYWPYADFHRLLVHEKSIEAARYLLSLGASDVNITWNNGAGKEGSSEADLHLPTKADITAGMGFGVDDNGKLTISIEGARGTLPQPTDLTWPDRDPMFKLARDAATAGAATFHFGIKTDHSTSVNASAGAKYKELGLSIGGAYKRWEDLTFTVDARFHQAGTSAED